MYEPPPREPTDNLRGRLGGSPRLIPLLLLLTVFLSRLTRVASCPLAQHDWKPVFRFGLPLDRPLFLGGELDTLSGMVFAASPTGCLWIWKNPPDWETHLLSTFLEPGDWWGFRRSELIASQGALSFAVSMKREGNRGCLVEVVDPRLEICLFVDGNSKGEYFQLVLIQETRMRILIPALEPPFFDERAVKSWLFATFHRFPDFSGLTSIGFFPFRGGTRNLFQNVRKIEELLLSRILKVRSVYVPEPQFPEKNE